MSHRTTTLSVHSSRTALNIRQRATSVALYLALFAAVASVALLQERSAGAIFAIAIALLAIVQSTGSDLTESTP